MIHSFLMIGQSNMAGRGKKEDVEPIDNKELKVLRNGRWQNMYVPVNCDRAFSGVSLAESFADAYQKDHGVQVGLIPCADGGTTLDQWKEGSILYDHAVFQAKLAMTSLPPMQTINLLKKNQTQNLIGKPRKKNKQDFENVRMN